MDKVFLSFDFYGAGNIGDDLMLEGFLNCFENQEIEFHCCVPRNFTHQQFRFDKVKFSDYKRREETAGGCKIWVGVGDTPVQVKSGEWFINRLEADSEMKNKYNPVIYFIGIGAEKEAVSRKDTFTKILKSVDHIWTRDNATTSVLTNDFNLSSEKVTTSSDLANIFLKTIFSDPEVIYGRKYELGFCYYDENSDTKDLNNAETFLKKFKKGKILLFGNDVNKKVNFEYALYEKMFSGIRKFLYRHINIHIPDYFGKVKTDRLVDHYSECKTVMTSRYHALLTAAWAGCRVISIERSSKVTSLAEELGIKEIRKPITRDKLEQGFNDAETVDRNLLLKLHLNALESVSELKNAFNKIYKG